MGRLAQIGLAVSVAAAAGEGAGCGGNATTQPELPAIHARPGQCPITRPVNSDRVPPGLSALVRSDAARSFGKDRLWVLLPAIAEPNAVARDGGYDVKVAWYLQGAGDLRVVGTRIDGTGRLSFGSAYTVPGDAARVQPSTLTVSAPGCYAVRAEHDHASITWIFRARE
jgi:hypothetical protein